MRNKLFLLLTVYTLSTFSLYSQGIDLPKKSNTEDLMKAEKPAPKATDTSDYEMNLDAFSPKTETKPRFEEYTNSRPEEVYNTKSDHTKEVNYKNYIPGTNNEERLTQNQSTSVKTDSYVGIILTVLVIGCLFLLYRRIFK